MSRHALEMKSVATLRKAFAHGRRGAVVITSCRSRYYRQMSAWGYTGMQAYQGWTDCCDVARLEFEAA